MSVTIATRMEELKGRIEAACKRGGRSPEDVTLVAVTKNVPLERLLEAIEAGVEHVGENRVQEAREKLIDLPSHVTRHMIGHLQTNKVRYVHALFDWIHSLDRLRLAEALSVRALNLGVSFNCLVQVNVSGEESKHGVAFDEAIDLVAQISKLEGISVRGLMTIAPFGSDEYTLRTVFRGLRDVARRISSEGIPGVTMEHLSMGMSDDFEIAIEEGATMVRVGSLLFGPRK